ncbi:MAG: cation-translocating P-type ATPase [Candidatus Nanopelagicales bacterium]|nr:cation-translocating P-type ATPase [Candidatus Nanopelagicales bacterium]
MSTSTATPALYAQSAADVARQLHVDPVDGLTSTQVADATKTYGPNTLTKDKPPSVWQVALSQFRDPMTLMLVAVAAVSFVIAQPSTAWVVIALIALNVVLGTNQEMKAQASVAALAQLQVPQAKVVRDGTTQVVEAATLVPGDVVLVEAGDILPADGRILSSASLETQEAALTGESVPVLKGADPVEGSDVPLGDQSSMLFQNTSVTRGSARLVVTATGMSTEVGRIADMLSNVNRTRSPLQMQLDDLTKKIALVAWGALAIILAVGLFRGLPFSDLMLLGISMAISAIPTGLPTFVQSMLAVGAKELAGAKAIVRSLTDVETLGSTSQINTDKTGTLTLNQMTARAVFTQNQWFTVSGEGYSTSGETRGVAGTEPVDMTTVAYVSALASDATVDDGEVVGDPTELAVVVLAEKLGVSVTETRRAYPRVATVPFDSDYKFMATFHHLPLEGSTKIVGLVKGGPDVVLNRTTRVLMADGQIEELGDHRLEIDAANDELASRGLRVLALALRVVPDEQEGALVDDPISFVEELVFVALVGIIDPLRPEAIDAVKVARGAGIDVRMITGDHLITAEAIGAQLGLRQGGMTGTQFAAASDEQITEQIEDLHVFGRVSPQDKLRLVQLMQDKGMVVAMTGDAVNDAAALKQADIGVAMGSGSEVTKQAARMVLTDDNFATLVQAISLGRSIFSRITSYIGYQMTQLFGLVSMFLIATAFNINDGVAMLPLQVLFLNFIIAVIPVIIISLDPPDPAVMQRPPRDPRARIMDKVTGPRWIILGLLLGILSIGAVAFGPGDSSISEASTPVTMGFIVMGLGTAFAGFTMHRTPGSSFAAPFLRPLALTLLAVLIMLLSTELGFLQAWLDTVALTGGQWLVCFGLALVFAAVVELDKVLQRRSERKIK